MAQQVSQIQITQTIEIKNNHPEFKEQKNHQQNQPKGQNIQRKQGGIIMWLVIVLLSASIPFLNLYLILYQPPTLTKTMVKTVYQIKQMGKQRKYNMFILISVCYLIINIVFVWYSLHLAPWRQMCKKYFLIQNIFICSLAANICYAAVHIICISGVFSTDKNNYLQPSYQPRFMDFLIIILYICTNISLTGNFKVLMIYIKWKPYQVIIFKLTLIISSLFYFITGIIFIIGYDSLSLSISDFTDKNAQIITQMYLSKDLNQMEKIPFFQNINTSIKQVKNTIISFIILYVFTNFALFCEIIGKMSDFDLTAQLKAYYRISDQIQK